MMCPMRSGSNGGTWDCRETACAWWDKTTNQCAIFILAQAVKRIENKRIQAINIEKEWGKDI
jgi:hypothetical protein